MAGYADDRPQPFTGPLCRVVVSDGQGKELSHFEPHAFVYAFHAGADGTMWAQTLNGGTSAVQWDSDGHVKQSLPLGDASASPFAFGGDGSIWRACATDKTVMRVQPTP